VKGPNLELCKKESRKDERFAGKNLPLEVKRKNIVW
jgi:hypothetical protein